MIYLDNCSTTRLREEVVNIMIESMRNDFGNPSSLHRLGMSIEKRMKDARENIAGFLNVNPNEIYFTSGGTESNNLAIQSAVNKHKKRGKHIITTSIEHPSVLNIMKNYEKEGFEITYLKSNSLGIISLEELEASIRKDTILVSIIHVNNEIGSIQPMSQIGDIVNYKNPITHIHIDGVQGFGKVNTKIKEWRIDSYSFSGHKIHGPKGIGGLYIHKENKLSPIIFGGNQERGIRSGTENTIGIIGFGEAVKIMANSFIEESEHVLSLKSYFSKKIEEEITGVKFNTGLDENSSPYIVNISFENTRGEVLLHYLEDKGIYVSTSSACSSKGTEKSHVLKSINLTNKEIEGAIRFCFSYENNMDDMDYVVEEIKKSVYEIRKITMR